MSVTMRRKKQVGKQLSIRLDADTLAAMDQFIAAQRVRPTETGVIVVALHEFLEREGYWPPKQDT